MERNVCRVRWRSGWMTDSPVDKRLWRREAKGGGMGFCELDSEGTITGLPSRGSELDT